MPVSEWLIAGRVGRPHGLDGSFHVTRPRPALLPLGGALRIGERDAEIVRRSGTEDRPILRVDIAASREEVLVLRAEDLLVARAAAPPLEPDEWYAEDLQGLRVVDGSTDVGTVRELVALPSCEVLEVERDGDRAPLLVPLVRDAVRRVDVPGGIVDVDLAFLGEDA
jgi:16S rRNA processing protein RimM